ncbi:hypothetical protein SISNIDRAFT_452437 [Sistotremastrum niveocremeum HHB9708]|uniref:Uncharacterized protein n=1 Tax=Sistotremastrum niveocremeum HHB9708 TaxID=1314777 RepID=A0A164WKF4_9AGAM|nr:hypothetical protein SISNIDRAFT_452437 [Sistotremastrum niveocremeum HHB9708]
MVRAFLKPSSPRSVRSPKTVKVEDIAGVKKEEDNVARKLDFSSSSQNGSTFPSASTSYQAPKLMLQPPEGFGMTPMLKIGDPVQPSSPTTFKAAHPEAPRPRKNARLWDRQLACGLGDCQAVFKGVNAQFLLTRHRKNTRKHRDNVGSFMCPHSGCDMTFTQKELFQPHIDTCQYRFKT